MNKSKRLIIENTFIKEAFKLGLSLDEFLLLTFFDNAFDLFFDVKTIEDVLQIPEENILAAYSSLLAKNIIKVEAIKNEAGRIGEKVSLEPFYQMVMVQEEKKALTNEKEDIFSAFEQEFGRTLSGTDYEIINAWIDKGFSEEIIKAALKEAVYNNAMSLRYIDKILYEWQKKGITKVEDIKKYWQDNDREIPNFETSVLNFEWFNESK